MEHNKEKQISEMAKIIYLSCDIPLDFSKLIASKIYNVGYHKASEVALEAVDNFQSRLRNIFCTMCNDNDYNTVCLLEIDSAIECLLPNSKRNTRRKQNEM